MELEDQLKQLDNLEAGNIEKVITRIENSNYDTEKELEKLKKKTNSMRAQYNKLIDTKLGKVIDNIRIMEDKIIKLDRIRKYPLRFSESYLHIQNNFVHFKTEREGLFKKEQIKSESVKELKITCKNFYGGMDTIIKFYFDNQVIFDKIILERGEFKEQLEYCGTIDSSPSEEFLKKIYIKVSANNSMEFAQRIRKEGEFNWDLINLLKDIPNTIARIYEEKNKKDLKESKNTNSWLKREIEQLKGLQITDF